MTKDKIMKAAFCVFADGFYQAHSPFVPYMACGGESAEEAMLDLREKVESLEPERLSEPTKSAGRQTLTLSLGLETATILNQLKREFDCTTDEALDILVYRYNYMVLPQGPSRSSNDFTDPK